MVRTVRVRYVPYAYGMKYAYGTQQLYDELSDNTSDDGLSLSASVAVNKQIPEVIPTPGNDAIFVVYQINARLILMHVTAHSSAVSIRLSLCKTNTNLNTYKSPPQFLTNPHLIPRGQ